MKTLDIHREVGGGTITLGPATRPVKNHEKMCTITLVIAPWPHEKPVIPGKNGVVDGFECLVARSGLSFGS